MARYAFVTRKGLDFISEVTIPCPCAGVTPYPAHEPDGYRVVFGFFVGQFTLDEIDRFMSDVAASSGSAPVARDYFEFFELESRVSTGGKSFQKNVFVQSRVQNIIDEYNDVKFLDSVTFECIQAEWFGSLSALQVVRLSEKVF